MSDQQPGPTGQQTGTNPEAPKAPEAPAPSSAPMAPHPGHGAATTQTLPQQATREHPTGGYSSSQHGQPAPTTWYGAHEPAGPVFPPPPAPGRPRRAPSPRRDSGVGSVSSSRWLR